MCGASFIFSHGVVSTWNALPGVVEADMTAAFKRFSDRRMDGYAGNVDRVQAEDISLT